MSKKQIDLYKVRKMAHKAHDDVNHIYGGAHAYSYHLDMVADIARSHLDEVRFEDVDTLMPACYLHDVIEDCRWTYNDVKTATNQAIADLVYDVTDELGKNRQERKRRTMPKIGANRLAVFVKLCDRIANASYSSDSRHPSPNTLNSKSASMYETYQKEYPSFRALLYRADEYPRLWAVADEVHNYIPV